jgi:palmitoyltransferase
MSEAGVEELASHENSMAYHDMPLSPLSQSHLPRSPAAALPRQISQGSSTRSIPPSSSSLTSPSNFSSSRPGERSRMSGTLHSHSHSATNHSQPRLTQPSAESSGHPDRYTALPPPLSERQRSTNDSQSQPPTRNQKLPTRAITPQRKPHRYCEPCGIVKPPRTHHCRTCGMVRRLFDRFVRWSKWADARDRCV